MVTSMSAIASSTGSLISLVVTATGVVCQYIVIGSNLCPEATQLLSYNGLHFLWVWSMYAQVTQQPTGTNALVRGHGANIGKQKQLQYKMKN